MKHWVWEVSRKSADNWSETTKQCSQGLLNDSGHESHLKSTSWLTGNELVPHPLRCPHLMLMCTSVWEEQIQETGSNILFWGGVSHRDQSLEILLTWLAKPLQGICLLLSYPSYSASPGHPCSYDVSLASEAPFLNHSHVVRSIRKACIATCLLEVTTWLFRNLDKSWTIKHTPISWVYNGKFHFHAQGRNCSIYWSCTCKIQTWCFTLWPEIYFLIVTLAIHI